MHGVGSDHGDSKTLFFFFLTGAQIVSKIPLEQGLWTLILVVLMSGPLMFSLLCSVGLLILQVPPLWMPRDCKDLEHPWIWYPQWRAVW